MENLKPRKYVVQKGVHRALNIRLRCSPISCYCIDFIMVCTLGCVTAYKYVHGYFKEDKQPSFKEARSWKIHWNLMGNWGLVENTNISSCYVNYTQEKFAPCSHLVLQWFLFILSMYLISSLNFLTLEHTYQV